MAATQGNQAMAGSAPEQGSENFPDFWNSSATSSGDGTIYQQEAEAGQRAEQAVPTQVSQLSTAAHADDAIGVPAPFSLTTEADRQHAKRAYPHQRKIRSRSPTYLDFSCADLTSPADGGSPQDAVALHILGHYPGNWQGRHVREFGGRDIFHLRLKDQKPPQRVLYQTFPEGLDMALYITDVYIIGGHVLCIFVDAIKGFPGHTWGSPGQRGFGMQYHITKICFAHPGDTAADLENLLSLGLRKRQVMPRSNEDIPKHMPQAAPLPQAMHSPSNGFLQDCGPAAPTLDNFQPPGSMPSYPYAAPATNLGVIQQIGTPNVQPSLYAQGFGFPNSLPTQAYGQGAMTRTPHQQFPPARYGVGAPRTGMSLHPMTGQDISAGTPACSQSDFENQGLDDGAYSVHRDDTMFETHRNGVSNLGKGTTGTGEPSASMEMDQSVKRCAPNPLKRNWHPSLGLGKMPQQTQQGSHANAEMVSSARVGQLREDNDSVCLSGFAGFDGNGGMNALGNDGGAKDAWDLFHVGSCS